MKKIYTTDLFQPGCAPNIQHLGDVFRNVKNYDFSAFGTGLSGWKKICIQSINKEIAAILDDKPIYQLVY